MVAQETLSDYSFRMCTAGAGAEFILRHSEGNGSLAHLHEPFFAPVFPVSSLIFIFPVRSGNFETDTPFVL